MALRLLDPNEGARNMGCMVWVEDLEKRGHTYGDLLAFLEDLHWPCVCSPIHDRDIYTKQDVEGWIERHTDKETHLISDEDMARCPVAGTQKKPHVHIYHCFKGPRKPKEIAKYFARFVPEVTERRFVLVLDWVGMVRYCAHMDSPNKAQYDPCSIHSFTNADISGIWDNTNYNKQAMLMEVHKVIAERRICNYKRLWRYVMASGDLNMMAYVKGNMQHFVAFFNADRQEKMDRKAKKPAGRTSAE